MEREGAGDLERHFRRVDVVILAIDQPDAEIDDRISGEVPAEPGVLNPFLDGGDVLARNRPAEDLVDKFEVGAARQRLDLDLAVGELAVTAGLLLVTSMRVRGL